MISIGLLLVVLPQLNLADYIQSTITSKFIVFAYSCVALFEVFLIMFFTSLFKEFQVTKLDIAILLLFGYISINRYFIQPNFGFSLRYIELIGLGIIYFIIRTFSLKTYLWLLLAVIISGIAQSIHGNLQLLGYLSSNHSGFKITGSFFNPGPYAGFLATVWPIALGMYLFRKKIIVKINASITKSSTKTRKIIKYIFEYIPLLGLISVIIVIPATRSRGAWLAVLLSSLVLLEFKYSFIRNTFKKINRAQRTALFLATLIFLFAGLFGIYHLKKGSSDGRLFIWKVTTEIVKDFPATGVGFDDFKTHYMNYQAGYFKKHGETIDALVADNTNYAFNEWLQFITENGFIGLLLLVIVLFVLFKIKAADENRFFFLIVKATFLGIGVFALVSYPMQILPIKIILVMLLALLGSLDREKYRVLNFNNRPKYTLWAFKVFVFVLGFTGIYSGYSYTKKLDNSFKQWKKASITYQYGDYIGAVEEYVKAYPTLNKNGDFLMNYGKTLSMNKQNEKAIQILEKSKQYLNTTIIETALGDAYKNIKDYSKAEIAYKHAANMIPIRFYPLYLQAKLYEESGENEKAIAISKTILKKNIKVPSTAIKEIKIEVNKILSNYNQKKNNE
ncbi:O-antigen ligase family protein [Polaribacter cellanae]|uniref:O-antigen ligase family protein n=1 Tax=Polaribacter cellanae TaxID=2818493 RepID=A0A975H810_9FLAO|nr:O-antigen ligase family protein [Polaribacter cellanae]QTE23549.1 O-antigen ligase family protein [Polaribacter cellanae]